MVDLGRDARRALPPVAARVVDVDVEPVLVRGVAGTEWTAMPAAEVADADARCGRMRRRIPGDDAEDLPDEEVCSPPPPRPVRPAVQERIPGEVTQARCRELHPVQEPPC